MTPRKEIFLKTKEALKLIQTLELIDMQRKQFSNPEEGYPTYFTAALILIKDIKWESMVENKQEGSCVVDVTFYCKDGWQNQLDNTTDDNDGLTEIDILDEIVEKLQFLQGDYFTAFELSNESSDNEETVMMNYTLSFTTNIYRVINPLYNKRKITISQNP